MPPSPANTSICVEDIDGEWCSQSRAGRNQAIPLKDARRGHRPETQAPEGLRLMHEIADGRLPHPSLPHQQGSSTVTVGEAARTAAHSQPLSKEDDWGKSKVKETKMRTLEDLKPLASATVANIKQPKSHSQADANPHTKDLFDINSISQRPKNNKTYVTPGGNTFPAWGK